MSAEFTQQELPVIAGAIALGAVCAITATLVLFPIIDRYVRVRFKLERGSAMLLLLAVSLLAGLIGGGAGYFWLSTRQPDLQEEPAPGRVEAPSEER